VEGTEITSLPLTIEVTKLCRVSYRQSADPRAM